MNQYANGRYNVNDEDILKWKNDGEEVDTLNTTFNKEIYVNFKHTCKKNGFFVKHVVTAFMDDFASGNLVLEYVDVADINKEK